MQKNPHAAVADFSLNLFDERACKKWLLEHAHPNGPACPECGRLLRNDKSLASWWKLDRVCCAGCKRYFTAFTGTMYQGTKLDPREIYAMTLFIALGVPANHIAAALRLSVTTVRNWITRFAIEQDIIDQEQLNLLTSSSAVQGDPERHDE